MRAVASVVAVGLVATLNAPTNAALPRVDDLFGCPLMAPPAAFETPRSWRTRPVPAVGVTLALPLDWVVRKDGHVATAESPNGQMWLSVRKEVAGDGDHLDRVRRAVELTELGPGFLGKRCETLLTTQLKSLGGWRDLRLSVTARALGQRRRAFALFAALPEGTLIAIVTVKWRREGGAPLALVRRLLRGLRAL